MNLLSTEQRVELVAKFHEGYQLGKFEKWGAYILFKCKEGHEFKATPDNILRGRWCAACSKTSKKISFLKLRIHFEKVGKIQQEIKTCALDQKIEAHCLSGHFFETNVGNAIGLKPCPTCSLEDKEKASNITLKALYDLAESKNGLCLSKSYVNSNSLMQWHCLIHDYTWNASASNITQGNWCTKCGRSKVAKNITVYQLCDLVALAAERGGKCLSINYTRINDLYEWQCALGHQWKASFSNVKNNYTWCPECSTGISEQICRSAMVQLFGAPFPKARPQWLKTESGNLELDGYNKDLRIAFEHNGLQHETDEIVKKRDKEKRIKCRENCVSIIEIPQLVKRLPINKLKEHIKAEYERLGLNAHIDWSKELDFADAFIPRTLVEMERLRVLAAQRNGQLLSNHYISNDEKLLWKCNSHGTFEMRPHNVKAGQWCPQCGGVAKRDLAWLNTLAQIRNGKCLSTVYKSNKDYYTWKCHVEEHPAWQANANHISRGSWCPSCAGKKVKYAVAN